MTRTIVIGVGNPILSDDSVGIRIARDVQAQMAPDERVDVTEMYAGGLRLMEAMSGYDRALIVDAVETGDGPPGTIHTFSRQDLRVMRNVSGVHDTSLAMALQVGDRLAVPLPAEIRIWGVEIGDGASFGEELTPEVAAAVPRVVRDVLGALQC